MGFESILGQSGAVQTLERALRSGRVHHAYRFEGLNGVGKELTAFAFAQALVCAAEGDGRSRAAACGRCSACARAVALASELPRVPLHPDVVLVERGLYAAEVLGRARAEAKEISVDQIRRLVLERASFPPHEGRARIFIVRRAHELSIAAANALLKTLEEPPSRTFFVLLTDRGHELLPTIRSRTQLVRFAPLAEQHLLAILQEKGVAPDTAAHAAELAGGSAAAALAFADPEATRERAAFVDDVLAALRAPDLGAALALSDARARDKEALGDKLAALAAHFARAGRGAAARDPDRAARAANAHRIVLLAVDDLERNASPALALEGMVARLRRQL